MDAVKLFPPAKAPVDWEYDEEADTLYISIGSPRPAVGIDVGEGVILRYDERAREVVGMTVIGLGRRLQDYLERPAVIG